ncbi:CAS_1a_G0039390.mRNA.1.CDS.1 [Saccharomyces cerevisiae]|nr:CAS_1a_G0039390.mRNA.1.CDS.1 [Saccharomyces cerevisiae]CAI7418241.1 CAS_1a_G0039390.mRNA.1.CDS.1 [Saccharomyces cerevisiae]
MGNQSLVVLTESKGEYENETELPVKKSSRDNNIGESLTATAFTQSEDEMVDSNQKWQNPNYFKYAWQEYLFIFTCMISQLLNQAGTTQTLSIMNILSDSFGSEGNSKSWLMASFPLVSGSFILISGRLGDIYGLKKMLLVGYVLVIIWSLICGITKYSGSDTFFIISRAFQGLGIAFVLPNVLGIIGNIYVGGTFRKNIVISFVGAMAPIGATLGCLFAGLIGTEDPKQWPWAFYAYSIAAFINFVLSIYAIPSTIPTNIHHFSMDWIGSVLGVIGLILLNFVWNQALISGWNQAYIIVILIISVIFLVVFIIYEIRFAKTPLLPRAVIKDRHMIQIMLALFFGWGSFGIFTFYYFQFQLNIRQYTALWAGGTYFMFLIWGIIAALLVGFTIKNVSPSVFLFFSMVAFNVGSIMASVTPVHETYFRTQLGTMIILSFGMDLSFPASSIIFSDNLPMEYQGMAGSLVNTVVNYSMSLCLGMGATVETQVNSDGKHLLKGYRGAQYLGIGLASLACMISGLYMVESFIKGRRARAAAEYDCTVA